MVRNPADGLRYFVKPLEVDEPFSAFVRYVQEQEKGMRSGSNVKYAQTRRLDTVKDDYYSPLTMGQSRK